MACRTIVPPYVLEALGRHANGRVRDAAAATLELTRAMLPRRAVPPRQPAAGEHRLVYDCGHGKELPGRPCRREGQAPCGDADADRAYGAAGTVFRFFAEVLGRRSVDDRGMHLVSSVHFGTHYDNAFWDGRQMVYGDGDGVVFGPFTGALDVVAHELAHGVTQCEAGFAYHGEPGALDESVADVFGSLVKQWEKNQTVDAADWLIGSGIFLPSVRGFALRSLAAPGSAYDDPVLGGKDPQPAHVRDYVRGRGDAGEVHVNSGIPNHAFYLFAKRLGGRAWETAGRVWYDALRSGLGSRCTFAEFAEATLRAAVRRRPGVADALEHAWHAVGVRERRAGIAQPAVTWPVDRRD